MYDLTFLKYYNGHLTNSGNKIEISGAITPFYNFVNTTGIYVLIDVSVKNTPGSDIYTSIKTQKFYPTNEGIVTIDIASLADPYLEYFVPPADLDHRVICTSQIKDFKVCFKLYNGTELLTEKTDTIRIFKGGHGFESFNPDYVFPMGKKRQNVLMETTGEETCFADDIFFLYFLFLPEINSRIKIVINYYYINADGETSNTTALDPFFEIEQKPYPFIVCIPAGLNQSFLNISLPETYKVYKYSWRVIDAVGNPKQEPIYFNVEQRNFYNTKQLLYRNSQGSLLPIRLKGSIETEGNYNFQSTGKTPESFIKDGNLVGTNYQSKGEETIKFKGETGFISNFETDRMRDFFLSPERYEVKDGRLLPIILNNKVIKFGSNSDNLLSLPIEWEYAFTNDFFSKYLPASGSCPTMKVFYCTQNIANQIRVFYSLPYGYDYCRVSLIFPGEEPIHFYFEGNKGVEDINFVRPGSADNKVDVRLEAEVVCKRYNKVPAYGAKALFDLTLEAIKTQIGLFANPDKFILTTGITSPKILSPSVLANDHDQNNNPLSVQEVNYESTSQGGTISITTQGIVSYTPPNSNWTGTDTFNYNLVAGATSAFGLISFEVGTIVLGNIFASTRFGYTSGYGFTYNDLYIQFKTAAGLYGTPLNVNGLTVNYRIIKAISNSRNYDVILSTEIEDRTEVFNGTETRVFIGDLEAYEMQVDFSYNKIATAIMVLPGTGYTVG